MQPYDLYLYNMCIGKDVLPHRVSEAFFLIVMDPGGYKGEKRIICLGNPGYLSTGIKTPWIFFFL